MKTTYMMMLLVLLISLTGCEEKASNKNPILVENTTEIFTPKDINIQKKKPNKISKDISISQTSSQEKNNTTVIQNTTQDAYKEGTFILSNAQNTTHELTLTKKSLSLPSTKTSLVLLNLCSETSSACISQLSSFSKLQKKYSKNIFIVSVWIKNEKNNTTNTLLQQKKANYFISYDINNDTFVSSVFRSLGIDKNTKLPLSVIYKEGTYYSHFEGAVPTEMIYHDIQQAIQK